MPLVSFEPPRFMRRIVCLYFAAAPITYAGGPVFADLAAGAHDARIVGTNPAGMSRIEEVSWRAAIIVSDSESTWEVESSGLQQSSQSDSDSTMFIPALFYVRPLNDRWTVGAALSATSGMGDDGDDNSVSRYISTDWSVGSFTFQPALAYKVDENWSIGAGLGVNYTIYSWEAAVFNGIGQPDGEVEIEPDDINLNYILSSHWTFSENTRLGLSWRSEYKPKMKDSPDYSGVDPDRQSESDLELEITMPQSVLAGIYHSLPNDQWLSFDVLWIETSEFNIESAVVDEDGSFSINPYQLNDTWVLSAGWGMPLNASWSVGLGALYVHDPLDDDNRSVLLRADSLWGIGASIEHKRDDGMVIGANLSYLDTGDAPVETPQLPVVGVLDGQYTDRTNLLFEFYVAW